MPATWSTPKIWSFGSAASSADMDTYVSDNLSYLSTPPSFSGSQTVFQSVPNATLDTIEINNIVNDPYAAWQGTPNWAWKAPVAGLYLMSGLVSFAGGTTGNMTAFAGLNGSNVKAGPQQGFAGGLSCGFVGLVRCNASDLLSLMVDQASGAAQNTASETYLDIIWVSF